LHQQQALKARFNESEGFQFRVDSESRFQRW
jgi:hypothetical protein